MILQSLSHIQVAFDEQKMKHNPTIQKFLNSQDIQEMVKKLPACILVLGGDGSMLGAIHEFHHMNLPFLGVHFGTKGYFMHKMEDIQDDFFSQDFPLLYSSLCIEDTECKDFFAFNEIDIRSANGRIITLEILLSGYSELQVSGDGIILSTPSGSTGYNSSLGGPIIPHDVNAFVLTPKAPWLPKGQTPILFSQEHELCLKNIGRKNTLEIYADARLIYSGGGESLQLHTKKSSKNITFLIPKSQLQNWKHKSFGELGFTQKK